MKEEFLQLESHLRECQLADQLDLLPFFREGAEDRTVLPS